MSAFERAVWWIGLIVGGAGVLYAVVALLAAAWLGLSFSKEWKR
jgi:hypothetical protein